MTTLAREHASRAASVRTCSSPTGRRSPPQTACPASVPSPVFRVGPAPPATRVPRRRPAQPCSTPTAPRRSSSSSPARWGPRSARRSGSSLPGSRRSFRPWCRTAFATSVTRRLLRRLLRRSRSRLDLRAAPDAVRPAEGRHAASRSRSVARAHDALLLVGSSVSQESGPKVTLEEVCHQLSPAPHSYFVEDRFTVVLHRLHRNVAGRGDLRCCIPLCNEPRDLALPG